MRHAVPFRPHPGICGHALLALSLVFILTLASFSRSHAESFEDTYEQLRSTVGAAANAEQAMSDLSKRFKTGPGKSEAIGRLLHDQVAAYPDSNADLSKSMMEDLLDYKSDATPKGRFQKLGGKVLGAADHLLEAGEAVPALRKGQYGEASTHLIGLGANWLAGRFVAPYVAGFVCGLFSSVPGAIACYAATYVAVGAGAGLVEDKLEHLAQDFMGVGAPPPGQRRRAPGRSPGGFGRASVGGGVRIRASAKNVTTIATGTGTSAITNVGTAAEGGSDVTGIVQGDIVTRARRGHDAETTVGATGAGGGQATGIVGGDISTDASRGDARLRVGVASGGGRATGIIGGDAVIDTRRGDGSITVGRSNGGSGFGVVGGDAMVNGGGDITVGSGATGIVGGDVMVNGGSVIVGGACAAIRDGKCCIAIHRRYCVLSITPLTSHGCPPRYEPSVGACYLFSDKRHRIGNGW